MLQFFKKSGLIFVLIAVLLSACSPGRSLKASQVHAATQDVSKKERPLPKDDYLLFYEKLDAYLAQYAAKDDKNIAYSPLGLGLPLSTILDMMSPQVKEALAKNLGVDPKTAWIEAASNLSDSIQTRARKADNTSALSIYDALWINEGEGLTPEKLRPLFKTAPIDIYCLPFDDKAKDLYQQWQKEKLGEALTDGSILNPNSTLALSNALKFEDQWETPFSENATKKEPFHNADGSTIETDMMHTLKVMPYFETADYQSVILDTESSFEVELILPKDGAFEKVAKEVSQLKKEEERRAEVTLAVPKLDLKSSAGLIESIKPTPLSLVLDPFPTVLNTDLRVSNVLQTSHFKMDEKGLSMKTLTEVLENKSEAPEALEQKELTFDRPFILKINLKMQTVDSDRICPINIYTLFVKSLSPSH